MQLIYLISDILFYLLIFSGVYESVATKGRQTLLRYQANKIADYEALYHTYLWIH
jgi:hypothetical protein